MLSSTRSIFQITSTLSSKRFMTLMAYASVCRWTQNGPQSRGRRGLHRECSFLFLKKYTMFLPRLCLEIQKLNPESRALGSSRQQAQCGITYSRRMMPPQRTLPTTNTLVLPCYCHFYLKRHFPIRGRPVEPKPTLWL